MNPQTKGRSPANLAPSCRDSGGTKIPLFSSTYSALVDAIKRIPPPMVDPLYPGVLSLAGLAVAERYGLITAGSIKRLGNASDSLMGQIAQAGQALNAQYPSLLPEHWLTSIQPLRNSSAIHRDTEGAESDEDVVMRTIAQILAAAIADQSLDATWLGSLHESLLERSSDHHPHLKEQRTSRPTGNIPVVKATRKRQGTYYTPPEVVDDMIRQTLHPALGRRTQGNGRSPATDLSVLDPACGGGAFLLAAYRFLLRAWVAVTGRTPAFNERQAILRASIFGVDVDLQAVRVTRFALHLECLRGHGTLTSLSSDSHLDRISDGLETTIQHGNALIADGTDGVVWEDAFPSVMSAGGFDVVIGNPPYLDSERMTEWLPHWRRYCVGQYASARGNWDLFCVFIEKALTLCKPLGYHSFIVPNKLVSAPYAAVVRSLLTTQGMLISIRDYSHSQVFAAAVYPLVYVVQRRSPTPQPSYPHKNPHPHKSPHPDALVRYDRMGRTLDQCQSTTWLPPRNFASPHTGWLLGDRPHHMDQVLHLCQQFPRLETLAHVHGAATVAEAYQLQAFIREHPLLDPPLPNQDLTQDRETHYVQIINSGTIDRYQALWSIKRLRYLGENYRRPVIARDDLASHFPRRLQQAIAPKIIVAGMTKRLECVADTTGTLLAGKSTSIVVPYHLPMLYVLGILNSQPMHHIVMDCLGSNSLQGRYLRIGPPQLKLLPIPLPRNGLGDRLVSCVEERMRLGRSQQSVLVSADSKSIVQHIQEIEHNIDQIVGELYQLPSD
jgi:hypothetical protein